MISAELKKQAKDILKFAKEAGVKSNFFFSTTFDRYMCQLECLDRLKERIKNEDLIIEKEYVKGSKNTYANPVLSEFNKTTDSANKSVFALIRVINAFINKNDEEVEDPLIKILNGGNDEEDD